MEPKIKILIVDDAAMVCKILTHELAKDPALEVVGAAADVFIARELITRLKPDVLLLDIEMPQMDGLTFLEQLMINCPMPVIIVSSLAKEGAPAALRALELGAAEVIAKPGPSYSVKDMTKQLTEKIKAVIQLKPVRHFLAQTAGPVLALPQKAKEAAAGKVIAIGAATGGPEAIASILKRLPDGMPPILIVQHMPPDLVKVFAEQLGRICALEVKEAEPGEALAPGKVLLAPGNKHIVFQRGREGYFVAVKTGPLVFRQRPSIEVLFRSVAMYAGKEAIGVILTGMGKDGVQGLLDMKKAGAFTIAQDEASSAVYGMPKEALTIGAVTKLTALEEIPQILIDHLFVV